MDQKIQQNAVKVARQRLTHLSSFDHYENASIFGEGLYIDHHSVNRCR